MAEIINLRMVKKRMKRSDEEAKATENRALSGRSKTQKALEKQTREIALKKHQDHLRERKIDSE